MDFGEVTNIWCRSDPHYFSDLDSEIISDCFVHAYPAICQVVIDEGYGKRFSSIVSLDEDGIPFVQFELAHFSLGELDSAVVVL